MKTINQWRTVIAILVLSLVMIVALLICSHAPVDFGNHAFDTAAWSILGLAFVVGGKSAVQHLAVGGGIKGAVASLVASDKQDQVVKASER